MMRLPLPFDSAVMLGFPRGIRTLGKATWYLHGGVSLQEAVIPHLVSHAAEQAQRLRVSFNIPITELIGATIPLRLAPDPSDSEGQQLLLQTPTPIVVRLDATADIGGEATPVVEPVRVEVRVDSPELATALYLVEGRALAGRYVDPGRGPRR